MSVASSDWFAVYTKPNQEHTALTNLERQSFECYLPEGDRSVRRLCESRKRRNEPLFPRYLFLKATPAQQSLASVRSTRGVVDLVRAGIDLIRIPSAVINALRSRSHPETGLIRIDSETLDAGDPVRIFDGPFAALEGIFGEHRGQNRSLLLLEILGRRTSVEVDSRSLRRVT